jgi:hypothetical protein
MMANVRRFSTASASGESGEVITPTSILQRGNGVPSSEVGRHLVCGLHHGTTFDMAYAASVTTYGVMR